MFKKRLKDAGIAILATLGFIVCMVLFVNLLIWIGLPEFMGHMGELFNKYNIQIGHGLLAALALFALYLTLKFIHWLFIEPLLDWKKKKKST